MKYLVFRYARHSFIFSIFLMTLLCGTSVAMAMGPMGVDLPDQAAAIFDQNHPAIKAVMATQNRHTDALMQEPGVVGTATGLAANGQPAVLVLVKSFAKARGSQTPPCSTGCRSPYESPAKSAP